MSRKIGRNAPCPCGSGKKYKRCCLHKLRVTQELTEPRSPRTSTQPIMRLLGRLDPLEVLIWLSATAAYPCNAPFLSRISLAMGLLLAALGEGRSKPKRTDIEQLLNLLENEFWTSRATQNEFESKFTQSRNSQ